MANEKFTVKQKKCIAKVNPSGKDVEYLSVITETSKSTVYKARREGNLLNQIEAYEDKRNPIFFRKK